MQGVFNKSFALATLALSAFAAANAQSVRSTINLSGVPTGVAVDYLANRVYVAIPSFTSSTDTLAVIDGKSDTVIRSISIPSIGQQVAVDVFRKRAFVGGCFQDANDVTQCEVAVVDTRRNKLVGTIPVTRTAGLGIQGLAVNSLTGKLYISNASDNVIDVVDCEAESISATISLSGESPAAITINPLTNELYVAIAGSLVDVVDANKNVVTASTTIGETNYGIAVNWKTGNVFVANNVYGYSTLGVLDKAGAVLADIAVGNTPFGVDVDLYTNLAFETNSQDGTVSVIDGKTNSVKATLPVSGTFVAVNPVTGKVYVSGESNQVIVLNEK